MFNKNILKQVLIAREERVAKRNALLTKYQSPIITISLNIPGDKKSDIIYEPTFNIAWNLIIEQLNNKKLEIKYTQKEITILGYEGFISVLADAKLLKQIALKIEDEHYLGRLFDIDIHNIDGKKLSREDFNYPQRMCLVCQKYSAFECVFARRHTLEETLKVIHNIINS